MNIEQYHKIVKKHLKKETYIKKFLISFLSGGFLGAIAQIIFLIFNKVFLISDFNARGYVSLIIIITAAFLTSIGIFDKLITKLRCGLLIPTTGFAHSIASSAIDFKKEGLIKGIGSNFFHLAGSVILYSVVVSFFLVILKVIFIA